MTALRDTPEYEWGAWGERIATQWLQQQGWFVVPTHLIDNGGAPLLIGQLRSFVLPDLQVAKQGQAHWVEVKCKTAPTRYMIRNEWRTGVDLRNWNSYVRVQAESGIPGELAIVHVRPRPEAAIDPHLLIAPFWRLSEVGEVNTFPGVGPRMMFELSHFHSYRLEDCEVPPLPNLRKSVRPWETEPKPSAQDELDLWNEGPEKAASD